MRNHALIQALILTLSLAPIACASSDSEGDAANEEDIQLRSFKSFEGAWGYNLMGERPDGFVNITIQLGATANHGAYDATFLKNQEVVRQAGTATYFPKASDASKVVGFLGTWKSLPSGSYLLLEHDDDGAEMYRVNFGSNQGTKTLELAQVAHRQGQGLHSDDRVGSKIVLPTQH